MSTMSRPADRAPAVKAAFRAADESAIVLPHGDRPPPAPADEGAVGGAHQAEDVGIDVVADAATNVVGAEDVWIQHRRVRAADAAAATGPTGYHDH